MVEEALPRWMNKKCLETTHEHTSGDVYCRCNSTVEAAIAAFLDQQRAYIEESLRDADADEFVRRNRHFYTAFAK